MPRGDRWAGRLGSRYGSRENKKVCHHFQAHAHMPYLHAICRFQPGNKSFSAKQASPPEDCVYENYSVGWGARLARKVCSSCCVLPSLDTWLGL